MSTFVEVKSVEKNCKVIINLDHIIEIAPLIEGGCALFFNDGAAVNGVRSMKVKDSYTQFAQFALQTVSSEDIKKKIEALKGPSDAKKALQTERKVEMAKMIAERKAEAQKKLEAAKAIEEASEE